MPPNPDCPEFYTGAPVDSADLLFREDFLAELWEPFAPGMFSSLRRAARQNQRHGSSADFRSTVSR